ncbi:Fe-S protein, radical SAM family [Candidatus Koribacter versatilis Ellin345]|uniref:Fe-S protein, radical SAM family n=1 Tax=Koribacter versatilis (strain Ellin345) TaxID=204669 RepID=Q1IPR5_KORVE|nr:radical SAM protein [Candidatus Koribacter versatilis]ABF41135.1 Fe-S protein, radical SAM family [Candidatus Koribacter versatilis Ellin345]
MPKTRPYIFYDVAVSICARCYRKIDAKIVFLDDSVYLLKRCPVHGNEKVLIADDVDYYRRCREVFIKPPEMPAVYNTPVKWGCPYDCGLCSDHEQHSCLSLIEICDHCNLSCPICYAESGPSRQSYRSLAQIEKMLDAVVRNELHPDVVQISGGEPTIHPQFFEVLDLAKARPIRHLMVNTNGIRIAQDEAFAERLATYMPDFELYLQFDSFEREPLMILRGADLRSIRQKAVERLNALGISTTLVVTLQKGLNDHEIGKTIDWALEQPCIRGVTFQPVQDAGRTEGFDPARDRLTLTEVRRKILEQTKVFRPEDVIPVPCHPDSLAMAYALKLDGRVTPLTGMIDPQVLINGGRNTILYEQEDQVKDHIFRLFSTNHSPQSGANTLRDLLCCLPHINAPSGLGYQNVFRVLIMQFIDAHAFDVRSVKKSCVHIVHPDGRLIPFDTYNMFYRDSLEQTRLAPLRRLEESRFVEIGAEGV